MLEPLTFTQWFLLIITGLGVVLLTIFSSALQTEIKFFIDRIFSSKEKRSPIPDEVKQRPTLLWVLFGGSIIISLLAPVTAFFRPQFSIPNIIWVWNPQPPDKIITPTPSKTPSKTPSVTPTVNPKSIKIGLVYLGENYIYPDCVETRLKELDFQVEYIDLENLQQLRKIGNFDILYFPAGWGENYQLLNLKGSYITNFLNEGKVVILEAPNGGNDPFKATFIPHPIYVNSEFSSVAIDQSPDIKNFDSSITKGTSAKDFQVPDNNILLDSNYEILVDAKASLGTRQPYIAVSRSSRSKILILNGTISKTLTHYVLENDIVLRLIYWGL